MKKFISWNVNGLRACVTKGFLDFFNEVNADVFCLQETKLQAGQIDLQLDAIICIGTTPKKRDTRALRFSQKKSR